MAETAIVTGAGRGIGAAITRRLATRGKGTWVAVVDRTESDTLGTVEAIKATSGQAVGIGCDVADPNQVDAATQQIIDARGQVDILVNCAGVTHDRLLLTMEDAEWDTVVDVNLGGAMLWSLAVGAHMKRRRSGRIVNFSSVASAGSMGQSNYAAAKAAISGLTRMLAAEFGRHGVTVNAVSPGFVATPMMDDLARRLGVAREVFGKRAAEQTAVGTVASPEDIAGLVAFLTGPESGRLTGQTIRVDGGQR